VSGTASVATEGSSSAAGPQRESTRLRAKAAAAVTGDSSDGDVGVGRSAAAPLPSVDDLFTSAETQLVAISAANAGHLAGLLSRVRLERGLQAVYQQMGNFLSPLDPADAAEHEARSALVRTAFLARAGSGLRHPAAAAAAAAAAPAAAGGAGGPSPAPAVETDALLGPQLSSYDPLDADMCAADADLLPLPQGEAASLESLRSAGSADNRMMNAYWAVAGPHCQLEYSELFSAMRNRASTWRWASAEAEAAAQAAAVASAAAAAAAAAEAADPVAATRARLERERKRDRKRERDRGRERDSRRDRDRDRQRRLARLAAAAAAAGGGSGGEGGSGEEDGDGGGGAGGGGGGVVGDGSAFSAIVRHVATQGTAVFERLTMPPATRMAPAGYSYPYSYEEEEGAAASVTVPTAVTVGAAIAGPVAPTNDAAARAAMPLLPPSATLDAAAAATAAAARLTTALAAAAAVGGRHEYSDSGSSAAGEAGKGGGGHQRRNPRRPVVRDEAGNVVKRPVGRPRKVRLPPSPSHDDGAADGSSAAPSQLTQTDAPGDDSVATPSGAPGDGGGGGGGSGGSSAGVRVKKERDRDRERADRATRTKGKRRKGRPPRRAAAANDADGGDGADGDDPHGTAARQAAEDAARRAEADGYNTEEEENIRLGNAKLRTVPTPYATAALLMPRVRGFMLQWLPPAEDMRAACAALVAGGEAVAAAPCAAAASTPAPVPEPAAPAPAPIAVPPLAAAAATSELQMTPAAAASDTEGAAAAPAAKRPRTASQASESDGSASVAATATTATTTTAAAAAAAAAVPAPAAAVSCDGGAQDSMPDGAPDGAPDGMTDGEAPPSTSGDAEAASGGAAVEAGGAAALAPPAAGGDGGGSSGAGNARARKRRTVERESRARGERASLRQARILTLALQASDAGRHAAMTAPPPSGASHLSPAHLARVLQLPDRAVPAPSPAPSPGSAPAGADPSRHIFPAYLAGWPSVVACARAVRATAAGLSDADAAVDGIWFSHHVPLGTVVDALDMDREWCVGVVLAETRDGGLLRRFLRIRFAGWESTADDWVSVEEARLAPLGTHTVLRP